MWQFILKRILLAIPTVLLVLTTIFIFTKIIPGDPVLSALQDQDLSFDLSSRSIDRKSYNETAKNLNLDKPTFYFSVVPSNFPSSIFDLEVQERNFVWSLVKKYGNPGLVLELANQIDSILSSPQTIPQNIWDQLSRYSTDLDYLGSILTVSLQDKQNQGLRRIKITVTELEYQSKKNNSWLPKVIWHGTDNQYHLWIKNAIFLDFGNSIFDGQPASRKILEAFRWTFIINFFSILLGYLLAIIIGVYSGWKTGLGEKLIGFILYLIYSIPVFWLATILVVFFTTPEYGSWTDIFPSTGIWEATSKDSFSKIALNNYPLFIIPILVLSTSLMAYIARIVRNSISEEKHKFYVQHARTKGLSENYILWHHVFRNASFPLITLIASVFPAALSGSLVVEVICNIPGTGRLLFESILRKDWAVVNGVVLAYTLLTVFGLLVSDILYRWADPRLKWSAS